MKAGFGWNKEQIKGWNEREMRSKLCWSPGGTEEMLKV